MDLEHVALVLFPVIELNLRAQLALVAAAMIAFSILAIEVPFLHEPFSLGVLVLLFFTLMLRDGLLVLLDDLVEEGVFFSRGLLFLLFVSLLLGLGLGCDEGLLALFRLPLLKTRNYLLLGLLRILLLFLRILFLADH